MGLDDFLLKEAFARGVAPVQGEVLDVAYSPSGKPVTKIETFSGGEIALESDFVAICT